MLLSAGEAAASSAPAGRGATPDVNNCNATKNTDVDTAKGTEVGNGKGSAAGSSSEPATGRRGTNKAAGAGKGGGKKKGAGKGNAKEAVGAAEDEKEAEPEEVIMARREREEREANVRAWVEGFREDLEGETFVTTAHRAAVATRDTIISELTRSTKVRMIRDGLLHTANYSMFCILYIPRMVMTNNYSSYSVNRPFSSSIIVWVMIVGVRRNRRCLASISVVDSVSS